MAGINDFLISSSTITVDNLLLLVKQATGNLIVKERLNVLDCLIVNSEMDELPANQFYLTLGNAGKANAEETVSYGSLTYILNSNTQNRGFIFQNWVSSSNVNYLVILIEIV